MDFFLGVQLHFTIDHYIYYYNLETKEKTLLSKEIYQEKYSLLD